MGAVSLKEYIFHLNDKAKAYQGVLTAAINASQDRINQQELNIDDTVKIIWLRLQEEVDSEYESTYKRRDPEKLLLAQKDTFLKNMNSKLTNLAKTLIKVS